MVMMLILMLMLQMRGPDKGNENGHIRDKIKEDDGDADAIPDGDRVGNQIEKPKQAIVDEGFKFANEVRHLGKLPLCL